MVCVWFPTSLIINLINELNGSRCDLLALMESPYTTLYQTVRTCHDISSDEAAWTDSIKKGVPNFGEM